MEQTKDGRTADGRVAVLVYPRYSGGHFRHLIWCERDVHNSNPLVVAQHADRQTDTVTDGTDFPTHAVVTVQGR